MFGSKKKPPKECMFVQLICHKAMATNLWKAQVNSLLNTKCPCCGQCGVGICFFLVIVGSMYLKIKEDVCTTWVPFFYFKET
jgi:hypothetical protein